MSEIANCPKCGKQPTIARMDNADTSAGIRWYAGCADCKIYSRDGWTEDWVITNWNAVVNSYARLEAQP